MQQRKLGVERTAAIGFVYETHPFYKNYLRSHFNMSHPLVKRAVNSLPSTAFLNGGVFLMDAKAWRNRNITSLAESIIAQNVNGSIYDSYSGDQGLFYVLFAEKVAFLPARFNMRRLPKKTINMLDTGVSGKKSILNAVLLRFEEFATLLSQSIYFLLFVLFACPLYILY
jgi:lipopolysaccharide biosynthesis glycosyltransferase